MLTHVAHRIDPQSPPSQLADGAPSRAARAGQFFNQAMRKRLEDRLLNVASALARCNSRVVCHWICQCKFRRRKYLQSTSSGILIRLRDVCWTLLSGQHSSAIPTVSSLQPHAFPKPTNPVGQQCRLRKSRQPAVIAHTGTSARDMRNH